MQLRFVSSPISYPEDRVYRFRYETWEPYRGKYYLVAAGFCGVGQNTSRQAFYRPGCETRTEYGDTFRDFYGEWKEFEAEVTSVAHLEIPRWAKHLEVIEASNIQAE